MSGYSKAKAAEQHLRQILGMTGQKGDSVAINLGTKRGSVAVNLGTQGSEDSKKDEMKIYCVDLSGMPRVFQFLMLCSATFFFYLIYGYLQELIFRLEEFRPYGWYLTLVQFGCYIVFGLIEMLFTADNVRRIPMSMYVLLAFLTVGTMGLSNTSVGYLNYPTQVIFKCCKLIPVMIGGVLIQGKRYSGIDVCAVLMMVFGLIWFTLADNQVSPAFNTYGVILISLALCCDGAIGNFQEKVLKQYGAANSEIVLYSYGLGFVYIFIFVIVNGDLVPAFKVCQQYPVETYGYAVMFSLSGYLGVNIVLTLVKSFGALVAVTVTTCRKAVTIILSFLFFTKPFTLQYIWSGLIVVIGIYLNVYSKNRASWDTKMAVVWSHLLQKITGRHKRQIEDYTGTIV